MVMGPQREAAVVLRGLDVREYNSSPGTRSSIGTEPGIPQRRLQSRDIAGPDHTRQVCRVNSARTRYVAFASTAELCTRGFQPGSRFSQGPISWEVLCV